MNNRIGKLVKDIQYATDFTIEQIADKIDYSRAHLTRLAKHGDSKKAYDALLKEFGEITQKVQNTPVVALQAQGGDKSRKAIQDKQKDILTTVTTKPQFEMKPTSGNDPITLNLSETVKNQSAHLVKQEESIVKLIDLLAKKEDKK